jgi:putative membrane protein
MYYGYHFWGMHLVWWFVWITFLFWVFFTPYEIPGKKKTNSPLEILQKRFAAGRMSKEEYLESKKLLEVDAPKVAA